MNSGILGDSLAKSTDSHLFKDQTSVDFSNYPMEYQSKVDVPTANQGESQQDYPPILTAPTLPSLTLAESHIINDNTHVLPAPVLPPPVVLLAPVLPVVSTTPTNTPAHSAAKKSKIGTSVKSKNSSNCVRG